MTFTYQFFTSFFQNALQAEISRCYGFRWIARVTIAFRYVNAFSVLPILKAAPQHSNKPRINGEYKDHYPVD